MSSSGDLASARAPADVLSVLGSLRHRTRVLRQGAGWLPLAVFGVVLLGSAQISRLGSGVAEVPAGGGGFRVPKDRWFANIAGYPPSIPASIYWLVTIPAAFVISGWWLRRYARRAGVEQPWVALALVGLLPFAALLSLRLLVEPHASAVHAVLQHESPSKWLDPNLCIGLGLLAVGVVERSRVMTAICTVVVIANVVYFVIFSDGVRFGSWQDHFLLKYIVPLARHHLDVPGLSGALLLLAALGWLAYTAFANRKAPQP